MPLLEVTHGDRSFYEVLDAAAAPHVRVGPASRRRPLSAAVLIALFLTAWPVNGRHDADRHRPEAAAAAVVRPDDPGRRHDGILALLRRDAIRLIPFGMPPRDALTEAGPWQPDRLLEQAVAAGDPTAFSGRAFLVRRPVALPEGLCGPWSVDFYLPPGVPLPTGRLCSSALLPLADAF